MYVCFIVRVSVTIISTSIDIRIGLKKSDVDGCCSFGYYVPIYLMNDEHNANFTRV